MALQSVTFPTEVVLGSRPLCPGEWLGSQLFPITVGRTPGDSLLPQNLESRRDCGTGTESHPGRRGGEAERPAGWPGLGSRTSPGFNKPSDAARELGEKDET